MFQEQLKENDEVLEGEMNPNYKKQNARRQLEKYWVNAMETAKTEKVTTNFNLPLARIKRLMKVEEEVKMMASEVPIIFSKVTEKFIEELTLRAWLNTDDNKRRILQRSDLSAAVRTSDVFDFLVYIIPKADVLNIDELMYEEGKENNSLEYENENENENESFDH
ncbi:hypothetical protein EDEG_02992 [Edhazardia aedis USNM 41457]|uniref:Transcription factor CBF/NF-Y/archaeal histone domain-containing protein n=1 Tax=Edhazardia aedis (strain USNM 41457) TaxID=1003232 RepID=J9DJ36_EDHAE|nr:hypothetical protein EDEG_02992 [Edhazardia aedis USNM 41457]|eukprot:EJW02605.1 hypothetical protein EDEG_02992 [Edhazardia aedis USNM 41457]